MKKLLTIIFSIISLSALAAYQAGPMTTNKAAAYATTGQAPVFNGTQWVFVNTNAFGGGGGATNLTPWTTDINGASFSLTNAGSVHSTNFVGNASGLTNIPGSGLQSPLTISNLNVDGTLTISNISVTAGYPTNMLGVDGAGHLVQTNIPAGGAASSHYGNGFYGTNVVLDWGTSATTNSFYVEVTNNVSLTITNTGWTGLPLSRKDYAAILTFHTAGTTAYTVTCATNLLFGSDITGITLTTNTCFYSLLPMSTNTAAVVGAVRGGAGSGAAGFY